MKVSLQPKFFVKAVCFFLIGASVISAGFNTNVALADTGTWGGIAIDANKNIGAGSHNLPSAAQASTVAVDNCKKAGGEHCATMMTFHGCVAIVRSHGKFYYGQVPFSPNGHKSAVERAISTYHLPNDDFQVFNATCNLPGNSATHPSANRQPPAHPAAPTHY